jgi:hypothetical protein
MNRDKLADGSKDILPPNVIKVALKQASISDLLNEAFQRGLTVEAQQEPAPPEFALLGSCMTKAIFDHLVIARRDALDAAACDIESIWSYLVQDAGYQFAEGMVKGDLGIPPDLWSSFIYHVIQGAAMSFLDIVEEDAEGLTSENNEVAIKT